MLDLDVTCHDPIRSLIYARSTAGVIERSAIDYALLQLTAGPKRRKVKTDLEWLNLALGTKTTMTTEVIMVPGDKHAK